MNKSSISRRIFIEKTATVCGIGAIAFPFVNGCSSHTPVEHSIENLTHNKKVIECDVLVCG